ncbi:MAG TPA: VCBS repeat-containing protein, partial [Vicinamibacterales bacterium]|nr:VCBS repeat-containing protein [Vicinamibacterales bacterium]
MNRTAVVSVSLVVVVLLVLLWLSRDRLVPGASEPAPASSSAPPSSASAPTGSLFTARAIGNAPRGEERPQIAHVAISDLDRDGLSDVLVCDSFRNIVTWIRQAPRGTFTETTLAGVAAPAHVEAVDFDKDGDLDLVVAALGFLFPNNNRVGSVIVLENDGQQKFKAHYIVDRVARIADARAADLDGDGDLDVSVAGFGYDDGETSWLENEGNWKFEQHVLQRLSGPINAIPTDINGDKFPDIVALV